MDLQLEPITSYQYDDRFSSSDIEDIRKKSVDTTATKKAAKFFGSYPKTVAYYAVDTTLEGTGTLAFHLDPEDVKESNPVLGEKLEAKYKGIIQAVSPKYLDIWLENEQLARSIDDHEKVHAAQPAKPRIKKIIAVTPYGNLRVGEMLIEGSAERALEWMDKKPPSKYFDRTGEEATYSVYRNFVEDLEKASSGITRLVFRAAKRASTPDGGTDSAIRLLNTVPGIEKLIAKYTHKLNADKGRN